MPKTNSKQKKTKSATQKNSSSAQNKKSVTRRRNGTSSVNQAKSIAVNFGLHKKSPHLINLKNPNSVLFATNNRAQVKPMVQSTLPKPPRVATRSNVLQINFANSRKFDRFKSAAKLFNSPFDLRISSQKQKKINKLDLNENTAINSNKQIEDIFAPSKYVEFWRFYIPKNAHKRIALFLVMTVAFIMPLQAFSYYQELQGKKDKILLMTNEAVNHLKSGQQQVTEFNFIGAIENLALANKQFSIAKSEVEGIDALTSQIIKIIPGEGSTFSAGVKLLEAGEIITEVGKLLLENASELSKGGSLENYYQALVNFDQNLVSADNQFQIAKAKIMSIKAADLPSENQEDFLKLQDNIKLVERGLHDIKMVNDSILMILGHRQWQRYMLVFVNNNELRGGGGFMGSFAIVDIDRGKIKNMSIPGGGTYDIQGQLKPKVISPQPLHLINARWEFQDSNWWPDYPASAQKMQWFYTEAGGPSVDGVITITASFMEKVLDIFGPISMDEYGRVIDSENFVEETQKIVELEYDREENKPKQFIADLAPKLLERIFSADKKQLFELTDLIKKSLNEKNMLIYFNDDKTQNIVTALGWNGAVKQTEGDYLMVVHSNIAGGKTDRSITQVINHSAEVQADGSIVNTVTLTRTHHGIPGENIFTGVQNNSYVRFYVPLGSSILGADGFEKPPVELFDEPAEDFIIDEDLKKHQTNYFFDDKVKMDVYEESSKTVFGNWLQLKPGETKTASVTYRLPFSVNVEPSQEAFYSLLIQKQAGLENTTVNGSVNLPENFIAFDLFPENLKSNQGKIYFTDQLLTDKFYGIILKQQPK